MTVKHGTCPPAPLQSGAKPRLLPALLAVAIVLALDASAIGFLVSLLRTERGLSPQILSWLVTLFVLGSLVGTPLGARLGHRWGDGRAMMVVCSAFGAGSILVALNQHIAVTLAGRLLQGLGSGPMLPLAAAMLARAYPSAIHGRLLALLSLFYGISFLLGTISAPWLLQWGIVCLYAALAAAALLLAWLFRSQSASGAGRRRRTDWRGLLLWTSALLSLALAINPALLTDDATPDRQAAAVCAFLALLMGLLLLRSEKRAKEPMLPLRLLALGGMRLTAGFALYTGAVQAVVVALPLLAALRTGAGPQDAAVLLIPLVIAGLAVGVLLTLYLDRLGAWLPLAASAAAAAAGAVLCLSTRDRVSFMAGTTLIGIGISGLSGGPLRYAAARAVSPGDNDLAQGLTAILVNIGLLMASAALGVAEEWLR